MPRFRVCTGLYSVQMWSVVKGTIFPYWSIITGGMNWGSYEPITDNVNFDVFIKKYAAVHIGISIVG